jgi:hypothetical protein
MRARYIKQGENKRVRIFTNNVDALAKLDKALDSQGFLQVGLLKFWAHWVRAGRQRRKAVKPVDSPKR